MKARLRIGMFLMNAFFLALVVFVGAGLRYLRYNHSDILRGPAIAIGAALVSGGLIYLVLDWAIDKFSGNDDNNFTLK